MQNEKFRAKNTQTLSNNDKTNESFFDISLFYLSNNDKVIRNRRARVVRGDAKNSDHAENSVWSLKNIRLLNCELESENSTYIK